MTPEDLDTTAMIAAPYEKDPICFQCIQHILTILETPTGEDTQTRH